MKQKQYIECTIFILFHEALATIKYLRGLPEQVSNYLFVVA